MVRLFSLCSLAVLTFGGSVMAQPAVVEGVRLGPYEYEARPDDPAFAGFFPRKAPAPGELLLQEGDRLAICGDSITEQRKYSRLIETYLTACTPELAVTVRQYGWSGEKTDGFLRRMEQDCLRFDPTVATLCYGMNDSRYRPFDVTNGQWYEDHYRAIVRKFKESDARVVVGSPGCAGKLAAWVKSRSGTLKEHNLNLCSLRDIAIEVAESEGVAFADVFWPMFQAQVFGPAQHNATEENPYDVAGADGIHPGWAGQVVMAYAFLRALGLDGEIATIEVDLDSNATTASDGHTVDAYEDGRLTLTSERYPFCAAGGIDDDNAVRSGVSLVPFFEDLSRFTLRVTGGDAPAYRVAWGEYEKEFSAEDLAEGINLAKEFADNPFSPHFYRVDDAVEEKQAFETHQVKKVFHGQRGKEDFERAVEETEAERKPLADAVLAARTPVEHAISITPAQ